jgi:hypothetical protein
VASSRSVSRRRIAHRLLACILAIAGWYLINPSATQKGGPDSYTSLSKWVIDGSYSSAADCDEAHRSGLNALQVGDLTSIRAIAGGIALSAAPLQGRLWVVDGVKSNFRHEEEAPLPVCRAASSSRFPPSVWVMASS